MLLPAYTRHWPEERRGLLIRHECAHIEQHDWLWQMVAQAVCAVFWFHPLVWLAASGLARESERAADDRVLAQGADAPRYAAELLAIARVVQRARWSAVVAMAGRSSLERRVRDILDRTRPHGAATRTARIAVGTSLAIVVVALSVPLAAYKARTRTTWAMRASRRQSRSSHPRCRTPRKPCDKGLKGRSSCRRS